MRRVIPVTMVLAMLLWGCGQPTNRVVGLSVKSNYK